MSPLTAASTTVAALAFVAVALKVSGVDLLPMLAVRWTPHAPDLGLVARQSLMLKAHLGAALTALAIGTVIMLRPKGRGLHKTLGWSWVAAMAVTAVSSFFLHGLNGDRMSLIHLLSGWTVIALPIGVAGIRRRNVNLHRRMMTGLFVGGLLIAGALTFLPGRLMWHVFFG
jgi:uncharacterized membrane protein